MVSLQILVQDYDDRCSKNGSPNFSYCASSIAAKQIPRLRRLRRLRSG
jgi:hypothetical protein